MFLDLSERVQNGILKIFEICCIHIESTLGGGTWHHHFSLANLPQGLNRFRHSGVVIE